MNQSISSNNLFEDYIPLDQQEDENDLVEKDISFKDAVVMNADWTIETINSQINKGNIDLDPGFQRRSAWDDVRQSRLIESIIVGLPIPNIVLAESKIQRGKFIVIDGKQRLLAINSFIKDELPLKGIDLRKDLNGKKYSTLPEDDRGYFENSTLRSTVIKNWSDEDFLFTIFFRLNSGSLPLSPQELRKALIGGKLLRAIETYISTSKSFQSIFGEMPDKRMRDSELVLRFIAFDQSLATYNGNLKDLLDKTSRIYEDSTSDKLNELNEHFKRLDLALETTSKIFGIDSFKKWLETGTFEKRLNRAIFDSLTRFFADKEVSDLALKNPTVIIESFKKVCSIQLFKDSIEKTTKSKTATSNRINIWGEELAKSIGRTYDSDTARIK